MEESIVDHNYGGKSSSSRKFVSDQILQVEESTVDHNYGGKSSSSRKFYQCEDCEFLYLTSSGLWRHKKKRHPNRIDQHYEIKCLELNCKETFKVVSKLQQHLSKIHLKPMDIEDLKFSTLAGKL